jgi:hypothetical protein
VGRLKTITVGFVFKTKRPPRKKDSFVVAMEEIAKTAAMTRKDMIERYNAIKALEG